MLNTRGCDDCSVDAYLTVITVASIAAFAATVAWFKERPATPPSGSAAADLAREEAHAAAVALGRAEEGPWLSYPGTALGLFRTPGFLAPTAAFVASIGVTNAVSAFTSETLHRAGFRQEMAIDEIGAAFQVGVCALGLRFMCPALSLVLFFAGSD